MPRTGPIKKRSLKADDRFHSLLVTRFVNYLMQRGKKARAYKIFYSALDSLAGETAAALEVFKKAIDNVTPRLEVRSRRVGGATYQVPTQLRRDRAEALAIRWLISAARSKKGKPMSIKLAEEIKDAALGAGIAVKKKEMVHRMAEANKAFAHFRW